MFLLGFPLSLRRLMLSLLLLPLLLMPLNLRPLVILLLPLLSQLLSVLLRPGFITLDAPRSLFFPAATIVPALPVLLKPSVRNAFVVPPVSMPIVVPVVSSPTGVHVKIEAWNTVIVSPAAVIVV